MPDQAVDSPESAPVEPPPDRRPINDTMGPHEYVESEFPAGKGRCDLCGGGPLHEIHAKQVDPLVRIASALEHIESAAHAVYSVAWALERIANQLEAWSGAGALDVRVQGPVDTISK